MDHAYTALSFLNLDSNFAQSINPLGLVNHILQAWFFSLTVCNLIAILLQLVQFSYAREVASSRFTKILGVALLFYLKIWDYYSGVLYIVSIFSLMMVALYVYDCCGNISQQFDHWKEQHRDLAVILSFLGMFSSTLYIWWQIYKNKEEPLVYEYSGIYVLQILLIVVGNLLRRRSILYSLFGVLTINYLIAARHLLHHSIDYAPNFIKVMKIPIQTIVYFMMAFDAQKRERIAIKAEMYNSLFKTCASLAAYSLLNQSQFPLQLLLGGIFIFGLIINK